MTYNIKEIAVRVQPSLAKMVWTMSFSHWGCIQVEEINDYMFRKFRMHVF